MSRLISELPEDIKMISFEYQNSGNTETDELLFAFEWANTNEGYHIWNDVYYGNYQPFYDFHKMKQLTPKDWCKEKGYNEYHVMIIEQYLNDTK